MAKSANIGHPNGKNILATAVHYSQKTMPLFYCANKGCNAQMILVSAGEPHAYFRSRSRSDHCFPYCLPEDIHFNPDEYDENLFQVNSFFENILSGQHNQSIHGSGTGSPSGLIGHNSKIAIHTLKEFYAAYKHVGISGTYGDCAMCNYICSRENYNIYKNGIIGIKVVELTYYRYISSEQSIIFNYPFFEHLKYETKVKVFFSDRSDWERINNHFIPMKRRWLEPLVIAGDWSPHSKDDCISSCIVRKRTQHAYIME